MTLLTSALVAQNEIIRRCFPYMETVKVARYTPPFYREMISTPLFFTSKLSTIPSTYHIQNPQAGEVDYGKKVRRWFDARYGSDSQRKEARDDDRS